MKRRYIYSTLFGVPGFIVSLIVSFLFSGFAAGVLWLFVFGDNPWPAFTGPMLILLAVLVFLIIWLASIIIGYTVGKRLEGNPVLNKRHVLASIGVTALIIAFILVQQFSVGSFGPKSEGDLCMDFCIQEGYSASSTFPQDSGDRNCSCLNESGTESITVPLDSLK